MKKKKQKEKCFKEKQSHLKYKNVWKKAQKINK